MDVLYVNIPIIQKHTYPTETLILYLVSSMTSLAAHAASKAVEYNLAVVVVALTEVWLD